MEKTKQTGKTALLFPYLRPSFQLADMFRQLNYQVIKASFTVPHHVRLRVNTPTAGVCLSRGLLPGYALDSAALRPDAFHGSAPAHDAADQGQPRGVSASRAPRDAACRNTLAHCCCAGSGSWKGLQVLRSLAVRCHE